MARVVVPADGLSRAANITVAARTGFEENEFRRAADFTAAGLRFRTAFPVAAVGRTAADTVHADFVEPTVRIAAYSGRVVASAILADVTILTAALATQLIRITAMPACADEAFGATEVNASPIAGTAAGVPGIVDKDRTSRTGADAVDANLVGRTTRSSAYLNPGTADLISVLLGETGLVG